MKKTIYNSAGAINIDRPITDRYGRTFNYLRLAVNEHCNLRCIYCMPEEGVPFKPKDRLLSKDEICKIIKLMVEMGLEKIRFTGGEPLLRNDLVEIIHFATQIDLIKEVHLTTNGLLLPKYIDQLLDVNITGINISLDTLKEDRFKQITRRVGLSQVLEGLKLAVSSNLKSVKLNVVAMKEFNDDEILDFVDLTKENNITVRFIELMPFDSRQIWKTGKFYKSDQIISDIKSHFNNIKVVTGSKTEHKIFKIDGYKGKVAVIPSYTRSLCGNCNRIRITADGKILNCLYSQRETNLRDAMRKRMPNEKIKNVIRRAMHMKLKDGWAAQTEGKERRESMTQIGG